MIIKTLRDAELALNNLQRELDALARRATNTSGVTLDEVRNIVKQSQQVRTTIIRETGSQFNITDIDATPSEGQIIHRLIHLFYEEARFAKDVRLNNGWYDTDDGLRRWQTDIGTANPFGGASPNYQIRWLDSVTPALNYSFFLDPVVGLFLNGGVIPLVDRGGDLGNTSLLWNKLWLGNDFNLIAQGTRALINYEFYGAASANVIRFRRAGGTQAAPSEVVAYDRLGAILFQGYKGAAFRNGAYFDSYVESVPTASTVAAKIQWVTTDNAGNTGVRWEFLADGHIVPATNNLYNLGSSVNRVKKLWAVDIDFSGTITGTLPGVDTNSELNANCSALLTLTTTFADVTGCSVSLNKNGKWLIIGNIDGTKELNDDEIQGQLVYDGTAQTGIIRMGASSVTYLRSTGTRSWILSVTGQPKTAKLQAKKVLGTGTSYVDTNSNIVAIYLST